MDARTHPHTGKEEYGWQLISMPSASPRSYIIRGPVFEIVDPALNIHMFRPALGSAVSQPTSQALTTYGKAAVALTHPHTDGSTRRILTHRRAHTHRSAVL